MTVNPTPGPGSYQPPKLVPGQEPKDSQKQTFMAFLRAKYKTYNPVITYDKNFDMIYIYIANPSGKNGAGIQNRILNELAGEVGKKYPGGLKCSCVSATGQDGEPYLLFKIQLSPPLTSE